MRASRCRPRAQPQPPFRRGLCVASSPRHEHDQQDDDDDDCSGTEVHDCSSLDSGAGARRARSHRQVPRVTAAPLLPVVTRPDSLAQGKLDHEVNQRGERESNCDEPEHQRDTRWVDEREDRSDNERDQRDDVEQRLRARRGHVRREQCGGSHQMSHGLCVPHAERSEIVSDEATTQGDDDWTTSGINCGTGHYVKLGYRVPCAYGPRDDPDDLGNDCHVVHDEPTTHQIFYNDISTVPSVAFGPVGAIEHHPDKRDPSRRCGGHLMFSNVEGVEPGHHSLVSVTPLTITASVLCTVCAAHGYITDGVWTEC